jgi:hypothetical protein
MQASLLDIEGSKIRFGKSQTKIWKDGVTTIAALPF